MKDLGSAAPQCGANDDNDNRSLERSPQQHRGWYSRGYLPHFDSPHIIQHITYRLVDSLPHAVLEQMQAEIAASDRDEENRKAELRQRIEHYLDAGYGSCVLQEPEVAACIVDTWFHFDGDRYRLLEWVVMPNHCHVLIEPFEGAPLGKIVLSWKNYTARFINKYKARTGVRGSQGCKAPRGSQVQGSQEVQDSQGVRGSQVWQREYWDRFIRGERHYLAAKSYIVMNPVKAGLVTQPEDWPWSSIHHRG